MSKLKNKRDVSGTEVKIIPLYGRGYQQER